MIIQEKPKDEIYNFFNKELFPLLNKYNTGMEEDYFEFKDLIDNPNIVKSRAYQQIWEHSCKIFEDCLSLSLDWILWVENDKNETSPKVENYYKKKENIVNEIYSIINYEKEIVNNSKANEIKKAHNFPLYESEQDLNDKMCEESDFDNAIEKPFDNCIFPLHELDENHDQLFAKNKSLNDNLNNFIFENKIDFINYNFYIEKNNLINNNEKNNNLNLINNNEKNNNNNNSNININSINNNESHNTIRNSKISINSKGSSKSYKSDLRKKKIKEFKFKQLKRENIDKKILRKFKKFLKTKLKEKKDNEVKNYINNNEFWLEYIKMNLMPPFNYNKENISFKSFNTQYLCWFFEHKFSLELFNIFIKINYDDLLQLVKNTYNLDEETDDYLLLKTYINTMPLIYGNEFHSRSTACSSNDNKPINDEIKNNNISIEEDKKNDNDICEKNFEHMIIEDDIIHDNENGGINNINEINVNNNNILRLNDINNINNVSNVNSMNKINVNNNNDFSNPQTFLYEDNCNMNLESNFNENVLNNLNLNDTFGDNEKYWK